MWHQKSEVLEVFSRQEKAYRLAILCSHWIRDAGHFSPSASETARGLEMGVGRDWISFLDLAEELEQPLQRDSLSSHFVLTHLYALICPSFEALRSYCQEHSPTLLSKLKGEDWYEFGRHVRNALSHNHRFHFREYEKTRLPVSWNGVVISADLQGEPIGYKTFWHKTGYDLFIAMQEFAKRLPNDLDQQT